jgi:hypothetical protein
MWPASEISASEPANTPAPASITAKTAGEQEREPQRTQRRARRRAMVVVRMRMRVTIRRVVRLLPSRRPTVDDSPLSTSPRGPANRSQMPSIPRQRIVAKADRSLMPDGDPGGRVKKARRRAMSASRSPVVSDIRRRRFPRVRIVDEAERQRHIGRARAR